MKHILYICCFILITSNLSLQAQSSAENIRFKNLASAQGLPQNTINCVIQDKRGILWFGTSDGLNRYDGYTFKVYKNELGNKKSLSNNYVLSLLQDSKGYIWVGTYGGGLNRFDPNTEEFVRFEHKKDDPSSLAHNDVRSIYEDKDGIIWICTYGGYFNSFNPKTNIFTQYKNLEAIAPANPYRLFYLTPDADRGFWLSSEQGLFYFDKKNKRFTKAFKIQPPDIKGVANNFIYSMTRDRRQPHILWLCTYRFGLIKFNTRTEKIEKRWESDPKNPQKLNSGSVWSIHQDKNDNYWVGTGKGLHLFNPKTDRFIRFLPNEYDDKSIAGENIQKVFEDKAGTIWLCTFDHGISYFNPYLDNFIHYDKIEPDKVNRIGTFCEDKAGNIWIGMGRGKAGLARFDRKRNTFELFKHDPNNPQSIASNTINVLLADVDDGSLWVGTIGAGLDHYDPKTQTFEHFPPQPTQPRTGKVIIQNNPHIGSLFQDPTQPDSIWVGTRGSGLFLFNKKSKKYIKHYNAYSKLKGPKITHNTVIDITKDYKGNLWVATRKGLTRIDLKQDTTFKFVHSSEDLTSISNNYVVSLHIDKNNILWIGTRNGLNRLDLKEYYQGKTLFKHYTTQQGLPNDVIHKIVADKKGDLWLSTNKGLSLFNKQNQSFKNYDQQDGLQADEFATGSGLITKDGAVLMGGMNGFNLFYPERLQVNNYKANILLTDFQIFNKSVSVTKEGLLKHPIWATDTIELSHQDNVISFEFAALNYIYPQHNTYSIMMENFDRDWRYIGNKNFETYTSLPAGTYIFRIRTFNNDQVLSDKETKLVIIVHPPWWETTWFRLSAALFIIALLVTGYRFRINIIKRQKRVLEHLVKKRTSELRETNEELQQTNEELQTTLTQIKKQSEMIQEFNENITESINYAKVMQTNMLPSLGEIRRYLSESFIFYRPRDVVSGDFYWFTPLGESGKGAARNADKVILVVGDCTGHGVPGAFMSIKGAVLLNQIINLQGITSPEAILHELDRNIHYALNQDKTSNRDGMDIGILLIDFKQRQLEFAGAKNNLLYIHEGCLYETKGHMLSVGGYPEYKRTFEKVTLPLVPNTHYYLTSDGYTDQFGGPQGKKFLRSRFKSLLLDMHMLPMEEQSTIIQNTFTHWKLDQEQIDDILVMGFTL
ncbi:hypothetical protein BKI52_29425 [marine bacterium AO1-C]|nr:hypothetical protein BKI52_29425 [marine bacterium AO1-C]